MKLRSRKEISENLNLAYAFCLLFAPPLLALSTDNYFYLLFWVVGGIPWLVIDFFGEKNHE